MYCVRVDGRLVGSGIGPWMEDKLSRSGNYFKKHIEADNLDIVMYKKDSRVKRSVQIHIRAK